MRKVAIYAVASKKNPYLVRYIGSALDPAKRLFAHSRGADGQIAQEWFFQNAGNLLCYVIEWVREEERLDAESYWIGHFWKRSPTLVNCSYLPHQAGAKRARGYRPQSTFDFRSAAQIQIIHETVFGVARERVIFRAEQPLTDPLFERVAKLINLESPWLAE